MSKYSGFLNDVNEILEWKHKNLASKKPIDPVDARYDKLVNAPFLQKWMPILKRSIKFKIPDNGRIFEMADNRPLEELYGQFLSEELHLPFPEIAIEFSNYATDELDIKIAKYFLPTAVIAKETDKYILFTAISRNPDKSWCLFPEVDFQINKKTKECSSVFTHNDESLMEDLETLKQQVMAMRDVAQHALINFLFALSCSNVSISDDAIKPSTVKQTMRRNKGLQPLYTYKVLSINASKNFKEEDLEQEESIEKQLKIINAHTPKRAHLRRGHIRTYKSGLKVWVNATTVGDKSMGVVEKSYKIK